MSLAQILSCYINLNLLLIVAPLAFFLVKGISLKAKDELRLHYFLLVATIFLASLTPFLPRNEIFKPAAKFWSAQNIHNFSNASPKAYISVLGARPSVSTQNFSSFGTLFFSLIFLGGIYLVIRDILKLLEIRRVSFLTRKIGSVNIYLSDTILVPFSYWFPGQSNVVVPTKMFLQRREFQMSIAHELQHHRNGDTKWIYVLWFFKTLCLFNPAIYLWSKWISETQEFACDEILVDRKKVDSQAYARCLVEVAQTAIRQKYVPVCATGLTFLLKGNILKRRIEKMFTQKKTRSLGTVTALAITALMAATAFASKNLVQDRRVSMEQAQSMAKIAQGKSDFPVVANDLVLKQLNRFIGTPEGREMMKSSLARMQDYQVMIESKINQYDNPEELLAIPIIESGYQNLPENERKGVGAGLWMFIASTAHAYGVDDRRNTVLETDAAMRLLKANYLRFKSWPLSVLAYNVGENEVQRALDKTGSSDPWTLIRQGYENDRDYLPSVMAAIIIMRNPDSLK